MVETPKTRVTKATKTKMARSKAILKPLAAADKAATVNRMCDNTKASSA